jgi:hypothetical protein
MNAAGRKTALDVASGAAALGGSAAHGAARNAGIGCFALGFGLVDAAAHRFFQVGIRRVTVIDVRSGQAADFGAACRSACRMAVAEYAGAFSGAEVAVGSTFRGPGRDFLAARWPFVVPGLFSGWHGKTPWRESAIIRCFYQNMSNFGAGLRFCRGRPSREL